MNLKDQLKDPIFEIISKISNKEKIKTFLIGGFVRDLIINRKQDHTDLDFVCLGDSMKLVQEIAKKIKKQTNIKCFKKFGTVMLELNNNQYEFVTARKESYRSNSRKPIVENGTLEDDQNRRDFTINALAVSLNKNTYGSLIDPFNGINDIEKKIIKTPLSPDITYSDDPLRMMRAIRFSSELQFKIIENSIISIKKNRKRISIVSQERITNELNKILLSEKPSIGLKLLFDTKLLHEFLPEIANLEGTEIRDNLSHKDNFYHTLEVVDNIRKNTSDLWLIWAALLHDIAKPKTKRFEKENGWTFHGHEFLGSKMVPHIFKKLKLPLNEKMRYVKKLVLLHLRPIVLSQKIVTDSAIRRLLFDAGKDIEDLMILCEADITSKNPKKIKKYLNNFKIVREKLKAVEEKDHITNWQPPVNGKDIMKLFNINPGKEVGILKNSLKDAILDGKIQNNKEDSLRFIKNKAKEMKII